MLLWFWAPCGRMSDFGNFLKFLNGLARPEYWPLTVVCETKWSACTLVPTVFWWHGKKEFKCHIHFSFSHDIEKQIWILLFVFRFRLTLKNGFELRISFFVFASLWKMDINISFRFSFSHHFEKRIWISFFGFALLWKTDLNFVSRFLSLWKTDLNFVCRFGMTWKTDHCTSSVIWSPGHLPPPPPGVDRGIHFLCNWK